MRLTSYVCMYVRVTLSPSRSHFFCASCFDNYVLHACAADVRRVTPAGNVPCPLAPAPEAAAQPPGGKKKSAAAAEACSAPHYAFLELSARLPKETGAALFKALQGAMERRFLAQQAAEAAAAASLSRVDSLRKRLQDDVLTTKCPKCSQAFIDFVGCCALTCSRCACGFCAFCLKDCGTDAHKHVAGCRFNNTAKRDVFASKKARPIHMTYLPHPPTHTPTHIPTHTRAQPCPHPYPRRSSRPHSSRGASSFCGGFWGRRGLTRIWGCGGRCWRRAARRACG